MPRDAHRPVVILLHGIGHSMWNMAFIETCLKREGYDTLNLSYPSRKHDIKTLTVWLHDRLHESGIWNKSAAVHFVCHSMGGLVAGHYLESFRASIPAEKMGRVVMLGTPHGGSEVADFLQNNLLYKLAFGPAGQELTTSARRDSQLRPWYDLGIVAGTKNLLYPLGMACIRGDHDGCVSVESTRLDGMKDHITLPVLHGFMGWKQGVHKQVLYFLSQGKFNHAN